MTPAAGLPSALSVGASSREQVAAYEHDLARYLQVPHVVTTSSGTSAIHTALAAVGVGPGDEVLVPALAVVMSAAPVLHLRARPVVVDAPVDGRGFDLADLARKTTARTRAILPVYLWGRADPAAGQLAAHAHDAGVPLVVDACPTLGTTVAGRQAGLDAAVACFSTHELKLLSTGEGGFLATADDTLAARARAYRSHWLPPPPGETPLSRAAHNFRLAAPLAALGRAELAHLPVLVRRRRALTSLLYELLAHCPHLTPEPADAGWNGYAPLLRLQLPRPRAFCEHLADRGVANSTGSFGLVPLDRRTLFRDPDQAPAPNAAVYLDTVLAVALTHGDDETTIRRYATIIREETSRWADA